LIIYDVIAVNYDSLFYTDLQDASFSFDRFNMPDKCDSVTSINGSSHDSYVCSKLAGKYKKLPAKILNSIKYDINKN
jgi:hypothetical protein